MQKEKISLPEMRFVGIGVRTNNRKESDLLTAKISSCVQRYFQEQLTEKIPHRKNPGATLCLYTDYESDFTGEYTFYIGEEVSAFDDILEGFKAYTVPPQTYVKFTTQPGPMPSVEIDAWQEIWKMSPETLGGQRRYDADIVAYDPQQVKDPQSSIVAIYIGIKT